MTVVVLDTHVLQWWSAEPDRVSPRAAQVIADADELVLADISWFELAWLAKRKRISLTMPIANWLDRLSRQVRSAPVTPQIAATAAQLPETFPGDPADRLIYATAVENGWPLITKDESIRGFRQATVEIVW